MAQENALLSLPRPRAAGDSPRFPVGGLPHLQALGCELYQRADREGKAGSKLLGRSQLSTTADIYTHTSAEEERQAVLAVERAIYGDLFATVPQTGNGSKTRAVN